MPNLVYSGINYFSISQSITGSVVNASIAVLDHAEVGLQLFLIAVNNYWLLKTSLLNIYKFDAFILEELKYCMALRQLIASYTLIFFINYFSFLIICFSKKKKKWDKEIGTLIRKTISSNEDYVTKSLPKWLFIITNMRY